MSESEDVGTATDNECQPVTVGFTVSKKVGNSVQRHRVKRQLRHLMRERLGVFPVGARVVVRALPQARLTRWQSLGQDLDSVIRRALRKGGVQ